MQPTMCSACGSAKIVPNVQVVDATDSTKRDLEVRVPQKPGALVFKEQVYRPLRAWICGNCGHVELFVPGPQGLYQAYLVSLTAKNQ